MASSTNPPTLSPRERFQKSVRNLSNEKVHRHRRNRSIHLQYNPYELERLSSLRVAPVRKSPYKPVPTVLKRVNEEPDFGSQERDVWSRRSPSDKSVKARATDSSFHETTSPSLVEDGSERSAPPLPQIVIHTDSDERPKTRRGSEGFTGFEFMFDKSESDANSLNQPARAAKFIEGTMNSRSAAVASTWSASDYASSSSEAEGTDSDDTPRASRKRRSGSLDLREFQPPTSTRAAVKRTLFGKREPHKEKTTKSNTNANQEVEGEEKKPRRRLRKSMSKLQFLGEKIKIFGASSHDVTEVEGPTSTHMPSKDVLNERKRKAEGAYAEQFGTKKQRDNRGTATITSSPGVPDAPTLKGNQKFESSTVRQRSGAIRSRRVSTGSMLGEVALRVPSTANEHDLRKRPTRRELEKENQQLRALLKESQAVNGHDQVTTYAHETEAIPPVPPLKLRRHSNGNSLDPGTIKSELSEVSMIAETAPPLPAQHPGRRVLSSVSNHQRRPSRRQSLNDIPKSCTTGSSRDIQNSVTNPFTSAPKLKPTMKESSIATTTYRSRPTPLRTVSVITEESPNEAIEKKGTIRSRSTAPGKENAAIVTGGTRSPQQWQWPDDVF